MRSVFLRARRQNVIQVSMADELRLACRSSRRYRRVSNIDPPIAQHNGRYWRLDYLFVDNNHQRRVCYDGWAGPA
jgi:hypothetical protein